jgi:hypothetical protein
MTTAAAVWFYLLRTVPHVIAIVILKICCRAGTGKFYFLLHSLLTLLLAVSFVSSYQEATDGMQV